MVLEKLKHVKSATHVMAATLADFIASLFHATGMPQDQARQAADILVEADPDGVGTHGVAYNIDFHYLLGERVTGLVDHPRRGRFCHYFRAIRVDAFRPVGEFKPDMDEMRWAIRTLPTVKGHNRVLYRGLVGHEAREKRIKKGMPLPQHAIAYFKRVAGELGVTYTLGR